MSKIGIITCGKEPNYGACLQAFATLRKIQELGYNAELINYSFGADDFYSPLKQPTLKSSIIAALFYYPRKAQCEAFDKFRDKYMEYSHKRLYNIGDFRSIKKEYSCFVTGSDQVWNPDLGIDINITLQTFLDPEDQIKRISYASSFGSKELKPSMHSLYKKALSCFDYISVREASGINIVKELLHNKSCHLVCDPVMLYDKSFWEKLCDDTKTPSEKYVVIYDMRHSSEVMNCALQIAKEKNCKVIAISRVKMFKRGIKFVTDLSPSQFLSYIKNAEVVVTDSFHGTVFSILFHKEFYSFNSGEGKKIGERLINILHICNLSNRLFETCKSISYCPIDYEEVDKHVEKYRMSSISYLTNSLLDIKK